VSDEDLIEYLAIDLCNTYYLTVDPRPERMMRDAYSKITEKTREHWRNQAAMLLGRGWTYDKRTRRSARKIARSRW
jgi:hypothetical protein